MLYSSLQDLKPILLKAGVSGSCDHSFVWFNSEDDEDMSRYCEKCGYVESHDC